MAPKRGGSNFRVNVTHPKHDWINTRNSQFLSGYLDEKQKAEIVSEELELRQASQVATEFNTTEITLILW